MKLYQLQEIIEAEFEYTTFTFPKVFKTKEELLEFAAYRLGFITSTYELKVAEAEYEKEKLIADFNQGYIYPNKRNSSLEKIQAEYEENIRDAKKHKNSPYKFTHVDVIKSLGELSINGKFLSEGEHCTYKNDYYVKSDYGLEIIEIEIANEMPDCKTGYDSLFY